MKYIIKSKKTGKYLSHLFEDTHNKTYQSKSQKDCYKWNIKSIAEWIALKENGKVIEIKN